jgi:Domain of unknown function (DUF4386)
MTRTTNARLAGFTYLFYFAVGIASMVLFRRATNAQGIEAKLALIAQHATAVRATVLLSLLCAFSALVLGVTLYAITRDEDPELAMLALACRLVEGVSNGTSISGPLRLLWLATAAGANAPGPEAGHALGAFLAGQGAGAGSPFFAVGSTLFAFLLLRGRMIPVPMAWLGVVASALVVAGVPLEIFGLVHSFRGPLGWLLWIPMLVFEVTLAWWLLIKGVAPQRKP